MELLLAAIDTEGLGIARVARALAMRVLIAYDGSEYGDRALSDLVRSGLHDVEAFVLSVGEVWLPPARMLPLAAVTPDQCRAMEEYRERAVHHARAEAGRAQGWIKTHFPHWSVSVDGVAGAPVKAIVERASSWPADLVVVGAHGHAASPRMFPGSVPTGVLRHVPCSVRIARDPDHRANSPLRLVLGVDGSDDAAAMLEQVRSRVWPPDTKMQVLAVVDTRLIPLVVPGLCIGPTCEDWAHRIADQAVGLLRECQLDAFASIERGNPRHVILDAARNWGADCIFVGARGVTELPWLGVGSVSAAVALRASCSVEVVRPQKPSSPATNLP